LVWLARQGLGRSPDEPALEALLGVVRHRRQLVMAASLSEFTDFSEGHPASVVDL
jgi:hypothetical protein